MSNNKEVLNDLLGYPGLKIYQRFDMFNFSLDSTILAYYVSVQKSTKKIVDLCTGNAYIPIFLSLRTKAKIYGVEIQKDVFDLGIKSIEYNDLTNQISLLNMDLKKSHEILGVSQFDVVTCNPPYFKYKSTSLINNSDYKTIARHEVYTNLEEVIHEANVLLKDGGTFAMVHRASRLVDILEMFRKYGFEPKRIMFVYPKINSSEALAIFIEGKKSHNQGELKVLPPLYVENTDGSYTKEILKIFNFPKEE